MKVAIIPARGGSKRIPKKNIRPFAGKPLIAYPIQAALDAGIFDRVIVTTDSDEIAEVARKLGAEVPFKRPAELSDDFTPTIPVIKHAIKWLNDRESHIEYCCCIYSNPFVTAQNLKAAYDLLLAKDATSVIPVTTFPFTIYRSVRVNESGVLEFVFPDKSLTRSQDLEEAYHDAGQFYWWDSDKLMMTKNVSDLQKKNRYPLIIPRSQVQDIDCIEDWEEAERLFSSFIYQNSNNFL
jgi:pseudaminic acid cytidylyltransferase